jgi:undecaprenyl-diphosphatase
MSIYMVVATAAVAAIVGDNGGYWIGRIGGLALVRRYGRFLHLDESKIHRARDFFERHGAKTVFIGRFIALLRTWAAVLAGAGEMQYSTFMLYNATGGITWAVIFGTLGYIFGRNLPKLEHYAGQASLALVLLGTIVVSLVLGARWFKTNSDQLAERVSRVADQIANSRLFLRLRESHPRAWDFIVRRFEPGEYLGLHLTFGLMISCGALWLFGGVTEDVIHHDPLTQFDLTLLDWLHMHTAPIGFRIFTAISWLGSPVLMATLAILVALVLAVRRYWLLFIGWTASLAGAGVLAVALKHIIQRPRPIYAAAFLPSYSYSFPSGHAMGSLIGYGMLAYLLVVFWAKRRQVRIAIIVAAGLLVSAIGFSRLYLGVHYFSDVIGGYAGGLVWLSACVTALELSRRQSSKRQLGA